MNNQKQSFMDKNTIIAVILVGGCWIGWQSYMKNKYPDAYKPKTKQTAQVSSQQKSLDTVTASTADAAATSATASNTQTSAVDQPEKLFKFENENLAFSISTKGMGLKNLTLKNYTTRDHQHIAIGSQNGVSPFETNIIGRRTPLDFEIVQTQDQQFSGTAMIGDMKIVKTISIKNDYSITTKIDVTNVSDNFSGFVTYVVDKLENYKSGAFFLPQYEHQEFFVKYDGTDDRVMVNSEESEIKNFAKANLVSVGSQYFVSALYDKSDILPDVKTVVDVNNNTVLATVTHSFIGTNKDFSVNYLVYAGPKAYDSLKSIDENLVDIVNYGWFSSLGLIILKLLRFFHDLVGNWGVAIILLTILVRLLVLPLYVMSLKSTKKMQAIQPQLKALREKYKEDPQRMNLEVMTLMKESKANPLGGCLPMLLQFPIFIALYQVLGQSIELYQAPFALWITDLSLKDPFYVLPVLTGLAIFLQQKITPTAMDPAQQKIMMAMPLVFTLFMVTVPSGLTLYIFVSSLTAVIQQIIFMKEKKSQPVMA